MKRLLAFLLLWLPVSSQAAISIIDHKIGKSVDSGFTVVTPTLNCTGATWYEFFLAAVASDNVNIRLFLSTDGGSTYGSNIIGSTTGRNAYGTSPNGKSWGATSSGITPGSSMTFKLDQSATQFFPTLEASCGAGSADTVDVTEVGTSTPAGPITTGSTGTLATGGDLVLMWATGALTNPWGSVTSINCTPTLLDTSAFSSGNAYALSVAYCLKSSGDTTAENATFTGDGSHNITGAAIYAIRPTVTVTNGIPVVY